MDNSRKKYLVVDDDAAGKIRIHKDRLYTNELVDELVDIAIDCYAKNSKHKFFPADRKAVSETVWTFLRIAMDSLTPDLGISIIQSRTLTFLSKKIGLSLNMK